jgi:hypothetical protein
MSTINGIGTTYIGCSAVGNDGSFITTKWLSFGIPIVPLGSYRVLPQSHRRGYFPVFYSSSQFYSKPVPFYWPHPLQVYGTYLALFVFCFAVDLITTQNSGKIILNPLLSSLIASAFSVLAIKISGPMRKIGTLTNIIVFLAILTFSFLLAAGFSKAPEQSLKAMYFFWGAFAIYSFIVFLGSGKSKKSQAQKRR